MSSADFVNGLIGLVGEEISRGGQVIGEHDRALDVGGLPWCQVEGERAAVGVTYGVDLSVRPGTL